MHNFGAETNSFNRKTRFLTEIDIISTGAQCRGSKTFPGCGGSF